MLVFGEGGSDPSILLVGEAPGVEENQKGQPFIGKSGKYLRKFLKKIHVQPAKLYMTNCACCWPEDNRDPTRVELEACKPRLIELINILDPDLILGMGKITATTLAGARATMAELRGRVVDVPVTGDRTTYYVPMLMTYHPDAFLHRSDKSKYGRETQWEDDVRMAWDIARRVRNMRGDA